MLGEVRQSQKDKNCMTPVMWYLELSESQRRKVEWCPPGAEGRREGELVFNGSGVSVLQDEGSSGDWWHDNVNGLILTSQSKVSPNKANKSFA